MAFSVSSKRADSFLRSNGPDFLLVLVAAAALTFVVSYAFNSAPDYRGNVGIIALIAVPVLVCLYAGSWSKRAVPYSACATVVVSLAVLGIATAASPDGALFVDGAINDSAGNYTVFALVAIAVTVLTFLLTRRTAGLVVGLVLGAFACGAVQYLYRDFLTAQPGIPATMVFLGAVVALFCYQTYKQSVYSAARVKKTSFAGMLGYSAVLSLVCVLVGLGVFAGIISGLGLTTPDIRPFEHRAAAPVEEHDESYSDKDSENDQTSDQTNDEQSSTNQDAQGSGTGLLSGEGLLESPIGAVVQQVMGYSDDSSDESRQEVTYLIITITQILIAFAVVALIVAAILFQRYRRKLRLKRMADLPLAQQTAQLYAFFMGRFARMKIRKPDALTPLEFALGFEEALEPFEKGTGGVTFTQVTGLYMDATWGGLDVSQEDFDQVIAYYGQFFRNAREYVGWPKWILGKFWRI